MFKSNLIASIVENLVFYAYFDWGGDLVDRKSVSGHYLLLNGNLIVWRAKKQFSFPK